MSCHAPEHKEAFLSDEFVVTSDSVEGKNGPEAWSRDSGRHVNGL